MRMVDSLFNLDSNIGVTMTVDDCCVGCTINGFRLLISTRMAC